jgi:hypothetical protein
MNKVKVNINEGVLADLTEHYTKANLQQGFYPYVKKVLSLVLLPQDLTRLLEKKQKSIQDLVSLTALVLCEKELFTSFFYLLPPDVQKLLGKMVWEEGLLHEDLIKERYGIEFVNESGTGRLKQREIKPEYQVLAIKEKYDWRLGRQFFIGLTPGIKATLADYFDKPEGYYLKSLPQVSEDLMRFNAEEAIFQELPRIMAYASQDNIKLSVSGLPIQSTFNKMRKTLGIKEFYEDQPKPFNVLRSSLLATLLTQYETYRVEASPLKTLQGIFNFFESKFYPLNLLTYLKGLNKVDDDYKIPVGGALMSILKDFPDKGWVDVDNILQYARYRSLPLQPAVAYVFSGFLSVKMEDMDGYRGTVPVSYYYQDLVHKPMLKAIFWLFAAFGLVEIAYDEPELEEGFYDEGIFDEDEPELSTPYDELYFVRLTPLGAYITGKQKEYSLPQTAERTPIQLLDDSLHILSEKPDETLDVLLDHYTVKTGPSRYRTDFKIFMKGVRNGQELEDKIDLFRQTVSKELPANWEAFFRTLRLKCDPLKSIGEHSAYQLSQEDQELMHLVAKDPVLKKLIIKAEGLIILVMKKNAGKFKSRLKEFGYLLE